MHERVKASAFQLSLAVDTGSWVGRLGLKQWRLAAIMVLCKLQVGKSNLRLQ